MKLIRTFHAVGQGAFYTECFQDESGNDVFNVVYDCGTLNSKKLLSQKINDYVKERKTIDLLFVSHFHEDHVNGISELLGQCEAKQIVMPFVPLATLIEQYIFNIIDSENVNNKANEFIANYYIGENDLVHKIESFRFDSDNETTSVSYANIIEIQSNASIHYDKTWEYIPFNIKDNRANAFVNQFMNDYENLYRAFAKENEEGIDEVNRFFSTNDKIEEMAAYYRRFFHRLNESSMAVISKPIKDLKTSEATCLFTGDYPFRENRFCNQLKAYFSPQWNNIGTIQIAHHGASNDNPQSLFDRKRDCIISYGTGNRYRHPGKKTIENICNSNSQLIEVTQNNEYQQFFDI